MEGFKRDPNKLPLKYLFAGKNGEVVKLDRQTRGYIKNASELDWLIQPWVDMKDLQLPGKEEEMSEKAEKLKKANEQFDARMIASPFGAAYVYFETQVQVSAPLKNLQLPVMNEET
eukprot:Gregarina_sp_Poly_1__10922@NODE_855_length_5952_cov_168_906542_g618_i0_p2_GENE_NODE_855_length_5952_cov_168_906542_g618_i0NODE_855_length_5952_cov_168_906542_g618_i0_p2_ORF_typecomplete_len116_score25_66_NODE_855_length_5952_cov_168_906542_g618_i022552602